MPIHSIASYLDNATGSQLIVGALALAGFYGIRVWAGGRKCTWEREWAGKMILVVVRDFRLA